MTFFCEAKVTRWYWHTMSLRGDWKFLKQIGNLKRHYGTELICYHCGASTGVHRPTLNYTDLSEGAGWRATLLAEDPWPPGQPPAISFLKYWHNHKFGLDALHIWHLGVGRDVCLDSELAN